MQQQRGLAGAVGADQADTVPFAHCETDAAQCDPTVGVPVVEVVNGEGRLRGEGGLWTVDSWQVTVGRRWEMGVHGLGGRGQRSAVRGQLGGRLTVDWGQWAVFRGQWRRETGDWRSEVSGQRSAVSGQPGYEEGCGRWEVERGQYFRIRCRES